MLLKYQEVTACEKRDGGTNSFLSKNVMSVHPCPSVDTTNANIYKSNIKLDRNTSLKNRLHLLLRILFVSNGRNI